MLSVIIPHRSDQYLQRTIDDLLEKAEGEIEVIVVADGVRTKVNDHPKVRIIYQGTVHEHKGMRAGINAGVSISRGEYIMKVDEHVMMDKGYDVKLIADCDDKTLVVPRRYRLDAEKWEIIEDGRPPIDYMVLDYPFQRPGDKTCGLHGAEDRESHYSKKDILIDDLMTMQGSCWFMSRKLWDNVIKEMDDENYGTFTQEAQELCNKVWFSGGRCIVNKKTWYAHWHKGSKGKGYGFSNEQYKKHMEGTEKGRRFCIEHWTKHEKFPWFIDKFKPQGWENWQERIEVDKARDYSVIGQSPEAKIK